ncbi:Putative Lon protease [endosymbiont DhMRE of Dentiscutata heterogama]|uniref:AAA family ATPase n=1 Tax=endosymbiont DhMRE of Dentiscutata heterogama TaxID=1609546 RepID=UPI000629D627|nr:AAA family ATPase [endosymbiont DhMRE of Dentiscutata heterogama]CFW93238.1 Putative Lon protease [endosymbiont DhMRE of Dentiscutata heterogama]
MTVLDRLNAKKTELQNQHNYLNHSSVTKITLRKKIKIINELIVAYQSTSPATNLPEAEEILKQQIGFERQNEKILNSLRIRNYREQNNVKKTPLILCLFGPSGVGKTTYARLLAQALKKEFFLVSLGGTTDTSLLLGASENSSGTEIGQLTKALTETKTHDPLILLDEIDKVNSYGGDSAIHNCLNAILDPEQNKEILDYYLDVKLDFSQATFVITANDPKKIPEYLLSRISTVVELPGYDNEQKKAIVRQFIQKWFNQNSSLNPDNLEITPEALETLINKTKEKGVRQLKSALDSIFDYCLLQWAQEVSQGKLESKVKIDAETVHKVVPQDFLNIDLEDNQEKISVDEKKELESLRKELERLKGEKDNQIQLKTMRFNSLLALRQIRGQFTDREYQDYEGKINTASSREEIEVVMKEFLLKIKEKITSPRTSGENGDKKTKDKSTETARQNQILTEKIKSLSAEIEKLKREIQDLQKPERSTKIILVVIVLFLMISGVYGVIKLLTFFRERERDKKNKKLKL